MLERLDPQPVWNYFEQFCAIPHPSGREKAAAEFIVSQAAKLGLHAITDNVGNVLVRKKGARHSTGSVILQCHLDMVPQKNETTIHDFQKDPIRPYIDGEWVRARGTTLGADNGIGVAVALAVLESGTIRHGDLEALFTVDEERGMTGAFGLADGFLTGRRLINLDTENEDEICIGCAGGTDIIAKMPVATDTPDRGSAGFSIVVDGLRGGHSGIEIHLNRGNALKLLARVLESCLGYGLRVHSLRGGTARNAIPREAFALVTVPQSEAVRFRESVSTIEKICKQELSDSDPGCRIGVAEYTLPKAVFDDGTRKRLLAALSECPYGVLGRSERMPDVVESSNNLSIVSAEERGIHIDCMLRSSSDIRLSELKSKITGIFTDKGASVSYGSTYPGWQPDPGSSLLATMKQAYRSVHGKDPGMVVVHAGLECGIIGARFPGMEMISCGPTIRGAHSPDERMNVQSVGRFWKWLVAGLERL